MNLSLNAYPDLHPSPEFRIGRWRFPLPLYPEQYLRRIAHGVDPKINKAKLRHLV